jgi:hypothetical protein
MTAPKGSRDAVYPGKPNHILGLGYMVQTKNRDSLPGCNVGPFGLRLINNYPNSHVNTLKSQLWERMLRVIGEDSMYKLLLETSIFMRVGEEEDKRMYYQLSGEKFQPFSFLRSCAFLHLQIFSRYKIPATD